MVRLVDYREAKRAAKSAKIKSPSLVEYKGRTYYVELEAIDGLIAEYFASTTYEGADIYVLKKAPKEYKRILVLHEIIQADLHIHEKFSIRTAHDVAVSFDRIFAAENLGLARLAEYETFRRNCYNENAEILAQSK